MSAASKFYRLDVASLEKTLGTLHAQLQKAQPSRFQRIAFSLLQITFYFFGGLWLSVWLSENTPIEDRLDSLATIFGFTEWAVLVFVSSIFLVMTGIVLVFVNLPLIRIIWRQLNLARKLNLVLPEETPAVGWEYRSPEREFWIKVAAGLLALVAAAGVYSWFVGWHGWLKLLVVLVVFGGPAYLIFKKKKIPLWVLKFCICLVGLLVVIALVLPFMPDSIFVEHELAIYNFYLAAFFSFPFLVFLGGRVLVRLDEQLTLVKDVDSLRATVERKKAEAEDSQKGYLEISPVEARRLAKVERAVIRQSRSEAIDSSRRSRDNAVTIWKSPVARSQIEKLTPKARFQVESRIQDLSLDPRPAGAEKDPATAQWVLRLAQTPAEIVYQIGTGDLVVKVLEVRAVPVDSRREGHE